MKILVIILVWVGLASWAEPQKTPPLLTDLFSTERNPGGGALHLETGATKQNILFGTQSGHYGLGLIFNGAALPEAYRQEFGKFFIIQIALGTSATKLKGQIPQFGVISILSSKFPTKPKTFALKVPSGRQKSLQELALLLFTSPMTESQSTEEEKLKGSFFAQTGTLKLEPSGPVRPIHLVVSGRKSTFETQNMKMRIDAVLLTPFSSQTPKLKGEIEFPLYWPKGKEAEELTNQIAAQTLGDRSLTGQFDSKQKQTGP